MSNLEPILYTSDCQSCAYLMVSSTSTPIVCPRCNSADYCTPPTPIYVSPRRPYYYSLGAQRETAYLEDALNRSFEDERDPEPRPASEQTLQAMQKIIMTGEYGVVRECGICLDVMNAGDSVILTPCCHHYAHQDCMEKSLVVVPYCPFCRWCAQN